MPPTSPRPSRADLASRYTEHQRAHGFGVWRPARFPRPPMPFAHTHPDVEMNYLLSGQINYRHGGVRHTVEPGRLALFWGGVPHQTLSPGVNGDGVWIFLPVAWLHQWKLPRDFAARLLAGEFLQFELPADLPQRWWNDHQSRDADRQQALALELQATLTRLALTLEPRPAKAPRATGPEGGDRYIARVTAYIAEHYAEALTVDDIAREARLHPTYLMRLFRRRCNVSLWEYVTRLRVSHAQRLLTTTNLRVLDIALESGFGSLAPFYQAFARYCGMRPLAFRRQQRAPDASESPTRNTAA